MKLVSMLLTSTWPNPRLAIKLSPYWSWCKYRIALDVLTIISLLISIAAWSIAVYLYMLYVLYMLLLLRSAKMSHNVLVVMQCQWCSDAAKGNHIWIQEQLANIDLLDNQIIFSLLWHSGMHLFANTTSLPILSTLMMLNNNSLMYFLFLPLHQWRNFINATTFHAKKSVEANYILCSLYFRFD